MLAYTVEQSDNVLAVKCSDNREIKTDQWSDILGFMLMPTSNNMALVWNVDYFVDNLCSIMPAKLAKEIRQGGTIYTPDRRKLYYQPSRMFGINHINVYGLSRYAGELITDAIALSRFGDRVIQAFGKFGINPSDITSLSSPVAVFGDILDRINFPRAYDLPDDAIDMIDHCSNYMTREWRQTYKLGHWEADQVSDYDLTAGYPALVAKLPDIGKASFFKSKTIPEKYSWGEMYGKLRIDKPISPFFYKPRECYPVGTWYDSITTDQLWLLRKYGIGDFEITYGYFFTLPEYYAYPFQATMKRLFGLRSSVDDLVSRIAKGISVGVWGKFAEVFEDNKLGINFNSIYARMVTSRCSTKVADFIYRYHMENDVISILVDGCLTTKKLQLPNIRKMGEWRINESLPALVLSILYQWQGDKRPGNVTYEEIMSKIKSDPNRSWYGTIDFNLLDYDRHFDSFPRTGGELLERHYESRPIEISVGYE